MSDPPLRELTNGRLAALAISLVYFCLALAVGGPRSALRAATFCLFSLALIWLPESLGRARAVGFRWVSAPSPGIMVAIMGWVILLLPAVLTAYHWLTS